MRIPIALMLLLVLAAPLAMADAPVTVEDVAQATLIWEAELRLDGLVAMWDRVSAERDRYDTDVVYPLRQELRTEWMVHRQYGEALPHAEALARLRGDVEDRISYAECLLGAVRSRLGRGPSISANINPYLSDLRTATEGFSAAPNGDLSAAQRVRVVYTRAHGLYLSRQFDDVVAWVTSSEPPSFGVAMQRAIYDVLARSHYERQRFDKAAAAFNAGGNPRAAAAAWSAGKYASETAQAYADLIATDPTNEVNAKEARRSVRYAGAIESFLAKLAALPKDKHAAPVLELRGHLLIAAGQFADAEAVWRQLLALDSERAGIDSQLARALLGGPRSGEHAIQDEAVDHLERALEADSEDELATALLWGLAGQTYSVLWRDAPGRPGYERCLRALRALVKARPDDATAIANLGNTLRVGGDTQAAHKAYVRAREENPYDPAIASDMGLVLSAMGRAAESLAAFEESVRLDAGHLAGRQNAARSLWRMGADMKAAQHLAIGAQTARARGQTGMTYRILMDRTWRTRRDPLLR